ncbi:hypothetical protein FACS1894137_12500 [Spirochaetia bacterium]|nr:hypothetical protein FACS1894137_12500 [Spirochaetia bacterium]
MPIQQTIEIPAHPKDGRLRLTLDVPREVPAGKTILTFTPAPVKDDDAGLNRRLPRSCANLEEALAASDLRLEAAETDPSVYSLKRFHGIWKDSKAWGQDVDVEAEIRKMRDSKKDYWGTNGNPGRYHRCYLYCFKRHTPLQ